MAAGMISDIVEEQLKNFDSRQLRDLCREFGEWMTESSKISWISITRGRDMRTGVEHSNLQFEIDVRSGDADMVLPDQCVVHVEKHREVISFTSSLYWNRPAITHYKRGAGENLELLVSQQASGILRAMSGLITWANTVNAPKEFSDKLISKVEGRLEELREALAPGE